MQRPDRLRLQHTLEAAREAQVFVAAKSREDLDADRMLQLALVRAIEIFGEAASQVSAESRSQLNTFPWREVIGMRNRLIHAYFNIDLDILWNTTIGDLPTLIHEIERALESIGE